MKQQREALFEFQRTRQVTDWLRKYRAGNAILWTTMTMGFWILHHLTRDR